MWLRKLSLDHFTVFDQISVNFCPGVNVVLGANGVGKSHLLKLSYACMWLEAWRHRESPTKSELQRKLASKLIGIYRGDSLGRLVHRSSSSTKHETEFCAEFDSGVQKWNFSSSSQREVKNSQLPQNLESPPNLPIFAPTSEVLSLYPRFASLYRDYHIEVDETYYDLCLALDRPLLRGTRTDAIIPLLKPLEDIIGGKVKPQNGRFYIQIPHMGELEIPLLAEGLRKIAAIAYLISNGSLLPGTTLFWDEPETNLNPQLLAKLAPIFLHLANQGIQVIISTHSLFLLKQFYYEQLSAKETQTIQYLALHQTAKGLILEQSNSFTELQSLALLDAELDQADQLGEWL